VRININEKDKKEIATIYKVQYSECQKQWRDRELMIQAIKNKKQAFFLKRWNWRQREYRASSST